MGRLIFSFKFISETRTISKRVIIASTTSRESEHNSTNLEKKKKNKIDQPEWTVFELNMLSILFCFRFQGLFVCTSFLKKIIMIGVIYLFVSLFINVTMNSAPRLVLTNLDRSGGKSEYYSADINLKVSSRK